MYVCIQIPTELRAIFKTHIHTHTYIHTYTHIQNPTEFDSQGDIQKTRTYIHIHTCIHTHTDPNRV
jgi:hypothetical protein